MTIRVSKRSDDWVARILEIPGCWGCGRSQEEAIGDVMMTWRSQTGIEIEVESTPLELKGFPRDGEMIIKVQVSRFTTGAARPRVLVYNRDRSYYWEDDASDELLGIMDGRPKAFFEIDRHAAGFVIEGEVNDQDGKQRIPLDGVSERRCHDGMEIANHEV